MRASGRLLLLAILAVCAAPADAQAQQFDADSLHPDAMRVQHMRSVEPNCEPNCSEWISLQGRVTETNLVELRKALARLGKRKIPILVHSTTGRLDTAMAMGRLIRSKGLDVVVAKTALALCAGSEDACRHQAKGNINPGRFEISHPNFVAICGGACPFILAGGVNRNAGPWTVVGLTHFTSVQTHRKVRREYLVQRRPGGLFQPPTVRKTLLSEQTLSETKVEKPADEKSYETIRKYFAEMGISDGIMSFQRAATEKNPSILRAADLTATGLATGTLSAAQYLRPPAVVVVPGTAVTPETIIAPATPSAAAAGTPSAGGLVPAPPVTAPAETPATPSAPSKPQPVAAKPRPKPPARAPADRSPPPSSIFQ